MTMTLILTIDDNDSELRTKIKQIISEYPDKIQVISCEKTLIIGHIPHAQHNKIALISRILSVNDSVLGESLQDIIIKPICLEESACHFVIQKERQEKFSYRKKLPIPAQCKYTQKNYSPGKRRR